MKPRPTYSKGYGWSGRGSRGGKTRRNKNPSYRSRRRSRSRSRSRGRNGKRSRSRSRDRGHEDYYDRRNKKPKRTHTKKSNVPNKEKKGESLSPTFTSPASFEEAWSGKFFLSKAIMIITSLGLSITKIPFLHAQALGGRLSQCLGAWDTVGVSGWVRKVVSGGYRIPFKTLQRQSRVPVNPPTEGVAFNILIKTDFWHDSAIWKEFRTDLF